MVEILLGIGIPSTAFVIYWWIKDLTNEIKITKDTMLFKDSDIVGCIGLWLFHIASVVSLVLLSIM
jgi:hypothetical protein